ncbi:hypothetical protein [Pseudooceanicola atlanticus]|uniref:Orotidine 5-phosphate decarboxylase n=1 Tax=Pseudooceanicola atlanticus TaxID=1461694 RepID=A0A0A0E8Q7_9RHOB|nr:hypothetical protein [Pseudooceanicola atlanticus]KGM46570.1 hypothetical protein ATO9_23170 [Pseudooceanicola atlanticus]
MNVTTEIRNIAYNPATRAFEARVTVKDNGLDYTYPCALRAPLDMDAGVVSRRLSELARRRHSRDNRPMHSHRPDTVLSDYLPPEVTAATDALWKRLLRAA